MDLADHVFTITDNVNKFPDFIEKKKKNDDETVTTMYIQRQDGLVNWVREQAKEIYICNWCANDINLNREPWRKEERLGLQRKAISLCSEHLAAIQLCRKHFKLSHKKVRYWGAMAEAVKDATKRWHESDKDRYRNI